MSGGLSLRGVTRRLSDSFAIEDVTFDFSPRSITGLIGPNGSGKTSLLNLISGLLSLDRGSIHFQDSSLGGRSFDDLVRAGTGRTFQSVGLPPDLTVAQLLRLAGGNGEKEFFIEAVELSALLETTIGQLSFGQARLVSVAVCLIRNPLLVMLDEPFAGLDLVHISKLVAAIVAWQKRSASTMIIVEHNITAVADMADRLLLLDRGRIAAFDVPEAVLSGDTARESFFG